MADRPRASFVLLNSTVALENEFPSLPITEVVRCVQSARSKLAATAHLAGTREPDAYAAAVESLARAELADILRTRMDRDGSL